MFIHSLIGNSIGGVQGVESRGPSYFILFFSPVAQKEWEPFLGGAVRCGCLHSKKSATIGKIAQHAIVGVRGRAGRTSSLPGWTVGCG